MDQALSRCVCRCKIDPLAEVNPVLLKFPENPGMQDKWLQAIKDGSGWNFGGILETSRLCSAHFKEEDLYRTSLDCLKAKEYAVPSIFETFPLANNEATRSSSRSETVTSASLANNEESSPSPPSSPQPETEDKINRKKQILRSASPGNREESSSPPNQPEPEDSKNLLTMTNMSADLEEMTETTDDEMETTDSKMEVIESEHMYTRRPDSGDEKPCVIKSENVSPPPSPPEIIKPDKKFKKKQPWKARLKNLGERRILPKPMILPDTRPLGHHTMSTRSNSRESDEVTGTVLMMEFDKDGDVNVTETLVKQAQKIKNLEKENKQLKTMVDNYKNMLKEMGVIVNVSFV